MSRLTPGLPRQKGEGACPKCNPQAQQFCPTGQELLNAKETTGEAYERNANNWDDYKFACNRYNRHVWGKGYSL